MAQYYLSYTSTTYISEHIPRLTKRVFDEKVYRIIKCTADCLLLQIAVNIIMVTCMQLFLCISKY